MSQHRSDDPTPSAPEALDESLENISDFLVSIGHRYDAGIIARAADALAAALAGKAQAEEALADIRREVGLEPDDGPEIVAESVTALRADEAEWKYRYEQDTLEIDALRAERDEALATADRATAQIEEHIDAQVNAEAKVEAVRAVYRLWNEHSDLDDDGSPLTYRTAVANLRAALDTTKEDSDG